MALTGQVISTFNAKGTDVMGPAVLTLHNRDQRLASASLLVVEAGHFAALEKHGLRNLRTQRQQILSDLEEPA